MRRVFGLAVLTLFAAGTSASIMGIDYGSEYIKIAAPKNNNIDIVLNEQSNRKTSNFIGFRGDERFFADDAKSLAPRFPDNMFTFMNHLIGVAFNDSAATSWLRDTMHVKMTLEEARKPTEPGDATENRTLGTFALRTGSNPDIAYTAETLVGMMYGYLRFLVKKDTGSKLRDAVVTIPASLSSRQRQAIVDSAALSGVNVLSTLHVTTAVALQYGLKNRGFGNATHTVVIFDMGAAHTDVGVYTFTPGEEPKKGKKVKNSEALGTLTTRTIVSDKQLGGRAFDSCLAELIEKRFVESAKLPAVLPAETLQQRKAVFALLRAANKAKEMLSANKQAPIIAEGMAPNRDFPTTITREEFEATCAPLFSRASELVEQAVQRAGVKLSEVDAVELSGGASRIPKLIDTLSTLRGRPVDRTLNTDEAAAIGAAFYGGTLTGRFRVKSFAMKENFFVTNPGRGVSFALSPKNESDVATFRPLFNQDSRIGQLKSVTVNRTNSFNITVAYNDSDTIVHDFVVKIMGIEQGLRAVDYYAQDLPGLTGAAELGLATGLNHPNNSHSVRIEFRAAETGLIVVEEAELRVNYAKNVTQRVKVNLTADELDAEMNATRTSVLARHEADEARRNTTRVNDTASDEAASANSTNYNSSKVFELKLQKALAGVKTYKFVPTVVEEMKRSVQKLKTRMSFTFPSPLTRGDKKLLKLILEEFDFADEQRRLLAKAKNDLEGYLIWAKGEGVLENNELRSTGVLSADIEQDIASAIANVTQWLEDDAGDATPREEYEERLRQLKSATKSVLSQLKQAGNNATAQVDQVETERGEEEASANATHADAEDSDDSTTNEEQTGESESGNEPAKEEDTASEL